MLLFITLHLVKNNAVRRKKQLDTMVELLLEKETIYSDEVDMIIDGKSKDEIKVRKSRLIIISPKCIFCQEIDNLLLR